MTDRAPEELGNRLRKTRNTFYNFLDYLNNSNDCFSLMLSYWKTADNATFKNWYIISFLRSTLATPTTMHILKRGSTAYPQRNTENIYKINRKRSDVIIQQWREIDTTQIDLYWIYNLMWCSFRLFSGKAPISTSFITKSINGAMKSW